MTGQPHPDETTLQDYLTLSWTLAGPTKDEARAALAALVADRERLQTGETHVRALLSLLTRIDARADEFGRYWEHKNAQDWLDSLDEARVSPPAGNEADKGCLQPDCNCDTPCDAYIPSDLWGKSGFADYIRKGLPPAGNEGGHAEG